MGLLIEDLQILFRSVPGLYLFLSPDLIIREASDAYLQATLTRRHQIIGRYLFDVFPDNPDDPEVKAVKKMQASIARVMATKQPDSWGIQRHDVKDSSDGSEAFVARYWRPTNTPVLGDDGNVRFIIHSVENVTDFIMVKRKAEENLERHARHLETLNEKLSHANIELEKLVYIASHDLQEPLRTIVNFARLVKEDYSESLDQKGDAYLTRIISAATRLQRLIKDLLDYSRSTLDVQIVEVDCTVLLKEIMEDVRAIILDRHAEILIGNIPIIKGDWF